MHRSLQGILAAAALTAASGCATAPRVRETEPWPFDAGAQAAAPGAATAPMPTPEAAPPAAPAPEPIAASPAAAPAVRRDPRVRFAGNMIIEHQFNSLGTVRYTDGSQSSIGDALFGLTAGAAVALGDAGIFEVQGVGGFLASRANASNGSLSFWAFPIELTAHARLGAFRVGAGPTLQLSPMLRGDGFAQGAHLDFDTSLGAVGELEWLLSPHLGLALRGTWTKLSANGASMDASRIGGGMSFYF